MKRLLMFSITLLALLVISGCTPAETKGLDFDALSKDLMESGAFTDILNLVDADVALTLYDLSEDTVESCVVFCSTGATAEEIALFRASDAASVETVIKAVEHRIESQISVFRSYVPAEVPKLKSAIVETVGNCVIYITSSDYEIAAEIASNHFNGKN